MIQLPVTLFGKARLLEMSISVILPVRNAQSRLVDDVDLILELLPELTEQFQLIVVDDASSDATEEIAADLSTWYPQFEFVRTPATVGTEMAADYGMRRADGDIVFVLPTVDETQLANLRRLWERRHDSRLVTAHAPAEPSPIEENLLQRLMFWGKALRNTDVGEKTSSAGSLTTNQVTNRTRMLRRPAIMSLVAQGVDSAVPRTELQYESSSAFDSLVISEAAEV